MIDLPESSKEKARVGGKIITNIAKSKADQRRREDLIEKTVQAWYNIRPQYAMAMCKYLADVTAVEHKNGEYKNGKGYVSLRLPRDLFITLRNVFKVHAPDMEAFGTSDDDIKILYKKFPKLMPGGFRPQSRKD